MKHLIHGIVNDSFVIGWLLAGAVVMACGFLAGVLMVWGVQ